MTKPSRLARCGTDRAKLAQSTAMPHVIVA
jgi:hypothetical protein